MASFDKLRVFLDSLEEKFGVPACECIVKRDQEVLFHHLCGHSDAARTVPATANDFYSFYSLSKLYTCTAALQLIERGKLSLEDKVEQYLPEYASMKVQNEDGSLVPASRSMTIFQLMTMTAGMNYDLSSPSVTALRKSSDDKASTREIIAAIANEPLDFQPGEHFQYSLCHDVLAAVIEVVSGMKLSEYMSENIFKPLGIEDISYNCRNIAGNYSNSYYCDENQIINALPQVDVAFQLGKNYESGGAGMCGRASEYIKLADALSCGGVGKTGARILSEESIKAFATDRLTPTQKKEFALMKPTEYGYGLGVRTRIKANEAGVPVGEFGWDGAAGSYYLIDPINRISIIYCEHILGHYCAYNTIHEGVRDLAYLGIMRGE